MHAVTPLTNNMPEGINCFFDITSRCLQCREITNTISGIHLIRIMEQQRDQHREVRRQQIFELRRCKEGVNEWSSSLQEHNQWLRRSGISCCFASTVAMYSNHNLIEIHYNKMFTYLLNQQIIVTLVIC